MQNLNPRRNFKLYFTDAEEARNYRDAVLEKRNGIYGIYQIIPVE